MAWSWTTYIVSVAAVAVSGYAAWREGNWRRRPGLAMGFADHGGMWDDVILLPFANAAIVPYLTIGPWLIATLALSAAASIAIHVHWYRGDRDTHSPEHMWPGRPHGTWHLDLSVAGWLHVLYVIGELTLLGGFLVHDMPRLVVLLVAAIFTIHVPIGLLQPRWFVTGRLASLAEQPLLLPCLVMLWLVVAIKWGGWSGWGG
jgi:hypothetical protein